MNILKEFPAVRVAMYCFGVALTAVGVVIKARYDGALGDALLLAALGVSNAGNITAAANAFNNTGGTGPATEPAASPAGPQLHTVVVLDEDEAQQVRSKF